MALYYREQILGLSNTTDSRRHIPNLNQTMRRF